MIPTPIRAAVLTIGSLFWEQEEVRVKWRADRLDAKESRRVQAPIRYGRRSDTRGGAYTMVFSRDAQDADVGRARLIPCKNALNHPDDLIQEAEHLWAAEKKSKHVSSAIGASWGCVGIMTNPRWEDASQYARAWADRFADAATCYRDTLVMSEDGQLRIRWPVDEQGQPVDVDIILATATVPSHEGGSYATAKTVAAAWNNAPVEESAYFFENRRAGITTAADEHILALLNHRVRMHGASILR
jgi:hypothetical protein